MTRIGSYEILRELGRGAMGVVYLAQDPRIQRLVAIKTIQLHASFSAEQRTLLQERFLREARAAGALSHPNIVVVYHAGDHEGQPYIVMEYVDGRTLEDLLGASGRWDRAVSDGLIKIARALDHAHSKGIIHRDVKPANILVANNGEYKISDFGIAKVINESLSTLTGAGLGTPNHMSPEQVRGSAIDGRSDQFALAIIAYRVLTGRMPFTGETPAVVCYRIVHEEPAWPSSLNPKWHPDVDAVMKRGLAKDPVWRYMSCNDFMGALAAALTLPPKTAGPETFKAQGPDLTSTGPDMKTVMLVAVALVVLVALGGLLVWRKLQSDDRARRQLNTIDVTPLRSDADSSKDIAPPDLPSDHASNPADAPGKTEPVRKDPLDEPQTIRGPRPVWPNAKDQLRYVWIPPGGFKMGCKKPECESESLAQHPVRITKGFWLGQTEVTVGAYRRFTEATNRAMPQDIGAWDGWKDPQQPMGNVSWDEAAAFCSWAGGRLPSEAEWEYAGRAGTTGGTYGPLAEIAWFYTNSAVYSREHNGSSPPVGLKRPNAFALYDMLGGVQEWVADYYGELYYRNSPAEDPKGPASGSEHTVRGGAWLGNYYDLWVWRRFGARLDYRTQDLGFRCANDHPGAP